MRRIYLEIDFAESDTIPVSAAIIEVFAHGLRLDRFLYHGPAGGNPVLTISGSREDIESWVKCFYLRGVDPDQIGTEAAEIMLTATAIPADTDDEPDPALQHERDTFVPHPHK